MNPPIPAKGTETDYEGVRILRRGQTAYTVFAPAGALLVSERNIEQAWLAALNIAHAALHEGEQPFVPLCKDCQTNPRPKGCKYCEPCALKHRAAYDHPNRLNRAPTPDAALKPYVRPAQSWQLPHVVEHPPTSQPSRRDQRAFTRVSETLAALERRLRALPDYRKPCELDDRERADLYMKFSELKERLHG